MVLHIDSLLSFVVKANSKAQGVLSPVPFPKIDEHDAMLNGSTVSSSLDCTSQYSHFGLSPEAEVSMNLRSYPSLAQVPMHFPLLINEVLKGLPFAYEYLDDILIFSETVEKDFVHLRTIFNR